MKELGVIVMDGLPNPGEIINFIKLTGEKADKFIDNNNSAYSKLDIAKKENKNWNLSFGEFAAFLGVIL